MKKEEQGADLEKFAVFIIIGIFLVMTFLRAAPTQAINSFNNSTTGVNLTLWDDTDTAIKRSTYNITFYANYSNSSAFIISTNCSIRFSFNGTYTSYVNMSYNTSSTPYYHNRTFTWKGNHTAQTWCYNSTAESIVNDTFIIQNSIPSISKEDSADWINFDTNNQNHDVWSCNEDTPCYFNFSNSSNNTVYQRVVTENDANDNLTYSAGDNTTLTNYTLNSTTGVLLINITNGNSTNQGFRKIELKVRDTESLDSPSLLDVNVTSVNDPPLFQNLGNTTINATAPGNNFTSIIYAIDEEANVPLNFTIIFSHCTPANWSSRNTGPNCTIWNVSQYNLSYNSSALFVNFTPSGRDDVGDYFINFTARDNGTGFGFNNNAETNFTINFSVRNVNLAPNITYFCNREFNFTTYNGSTLIPEFNISENSAFNCYVNATDIDETLNLTFSSNETWFLNTTNGSFGNFNGSAFVNFTPVDLIVGNWTVNITVKDNTGTPPSKNDTKLVRIFISNINDSVNVFSVSNFTGFTGNNYNIYVNATDNDLSVPNKQVFNESINFTARNLTSGEAVSWITVSKLSNSGNISRAVLTFTANSTISGNTTINLSVMDVNNYSQSSTIFIIQIIGNSPPNWSSNLSRNFTLTEGTAFSLNLTGNVTDADGDSINFTYTNYSQTHFPNFFSNANTTTGVISFTPADDDVGSNNVSINASDGRTPTPITINFTVNNVNDAPSFDSISTQTVSEDSQASFNVVIFDEDFKIKQKGFCAGCNENLTLNLTISGPNTALLINGSNFNLTQNPTTDAPNRTIYAATFTPNKSDLGGLTQRNYTVYLEARDQSGVNDTTSFMITINSINHGPNITIVSNQTTYLGANLTVLFNVTDLEDNSTDAGGTFNFTYSFLSGTDFLNTTTFNRTRGILNVTINSTINGLYHLNVTVNDSSNLQASTDFWIKVYNTPYFLSYLPAAVYSAENSTILINITANHSIGDNLNYSIIINGTVRNSTLGTGNGSNNATMSLTFNFSDETNCITMGNMTINVSNTYFSNSTRINLTVNHTNSPLAFTSTITNTTAGGSVQYTLSDYFSDLDVDTNTCGNNTVNFTLVRMNASFSTLSTTTFTVSLTNWTNSATPTLNASTATAATEYFQVIANDTYAIAKSNNFSVNLTPSVVTTTTPVSGGGGGGGGVKPVSLKLIFPDQISSFKYDEIVVPITLYNSGQASLSDIELKSFIAKNETIASDIKMSLSRSSFDTLNVGDKKYTNLTISINTKKAGRFEITVNATVRNPAYSDWGKFFLNIVETNKTEVEQVILFTDELIVQNPECAELQESLNRAKKAMSEGKIDDAWQYANEVVRACRNAISQRPSVTKADKPERDIIAYLAFSTIAVLFLVFVYHIYNRIKIKRYGAV